MTRNIEITKTETIEISDNSIKDTVEVKISSKENFLDFTKKWNGVKPVPALFLLFIASSMWLAPTPEGLSDKAWHLFIIFASTIGGVILKALPMASLALVSLTLCCITATLTVEESLTSFSSPITWLVVLAFLLARGFIKTGLGTRLSYILLQLMGKSTLGLGYSFAITEGLLSIIIPSNTARGGGVIYPIVESLNKEYGSSPQEGTQRRIGAYLIKICYQSNTITSAMFLTALAGNPLLASLSADIGIPLTWSTWAFVALVPCLCCLAALPWILYKIYPPEIKSTPEIPGRAKEKLKEMGALSTDEVMMLSVFGLILFLWAFGKQFGVSPTLAILIGISTLLLSGVLTWDDALSEKGAWTSLIWFAIFLTMATYLYKFGLMSWFSGHMKTLVTGLTWQSALLCLSLVYFFVHYFFASVTAHISALFSVFLLVTISLGAPPLLTTMVFAILSSFSAGLTHYGNGAAPIFFGAGYLQINEWWRLGAIIGIINLMILGTVGLTWWKLIGLW